jgi:hypothetical protein
MTETRQITYQGSGPLVRTLVQALEAEGVSVTVRRNRPYVGEHRDPRGMGGAVAVTLVATGATEAIKAGVGSFRQRFTDGALVTMEAEEPVRPGHGRDRA